MKHLVNFFGCWLCAFTVSAQTGLSDSVSAFDHSTVLKINPQRIVYGGLSLAVEQTIGRRSSVQLEAYQSIGNGRFVRVMGKTTSLTASFLYYPLSRQEAPNGLYFGSALSYGHYTNSSLWRLFKIFDTSPSASIGYLQALAGYQYCSRRNLVFDAGASLGFLHTLVYSRDGLSGQPITTKHVTRFGLLPGLWFRVGYRFGYRRPQ